MIHEIHLENLAVIESLDISFTSGFTALTGETGAGKSLLIQAMGLIAGQRTNAEVIRNTSDQALVEARLTLSDPAAEQELSEQGYGNGDFIVRRIIRTDGNHRVYINGRLATASILQLCIAPELEIHAQHSQQRLLDSETQRDLLDTFGGLGSFRDKVASCYTVWKETENEIVSLVAKTDNREQELDYLRFQLDEFQRVDPKPGEVQKIEDKIRTVRGGAELAQGLEQLRNLIQDEDGSILDRLYSCIDILDKVSGIDSHLKPAQDKLEQISTEIQETYKQLPSYEQEENMQMLESLESRLTELNKMLRKYDGNMDVLFQARDDMQGSVQQLDAAEQTLISLQNQADKQKLDYEKSANGLSRKRQKVAVDLGLTVSETLHQLEMPHAVFSIDGWGEGEPAVHGIDRVRFELAANPGDEPRAIRKVASGGELSRILLAVQSAIGLVHRGSTVVFDEADAGIGGETAQTVGANLRRLGDTHQVFVVTHTPQVAAQAHQQIHLEKGMMNERACTVARQLSQQQRIDELAGMLGVRDTATAAEHAKTLLTSVAP